MKTYKILFWITAVLLFLTQGLMPLFTMNSEGSREAMRHLGYPVYFGNMLAVFKFLGSLAIIIPQVPSRVKEWAFAGFAIDFLCASLSFWAIDGATGFVLFPVIALLILMVCYFSYYRLNSGKL
ncbi:MAG: DoxX family protein [Chitinophagaceae bacterium]|uniref:DoxX family protein n=1 Tax=Rurimicrobium arvi TaxID=2049916 RepID=A0ABP8MU87_9BACT